MANPVFPTKRKYYPGIDNPLFLGDITTGYDSDMSVMASLSGLKDGDFYIVSGLEYVLGTPNSYSPGVVYFNNDFFYCPIPFTEGLRLATYYQDMLSETFNDTVARNIYTNQVATPTSTASGSTPLFNGDMNEYRLNSKFLQQNVLTLLAIADNLGTAANANLGTGIGEILTADQTYNQAQVNALLMTRGPSCIGSVQFIRDATGTFLSNFDGNGLGIVYPWYNAATGERWGIMNGVATAGGHTTPNSAGKTFIGQGTDAGSHTFTEGNTYGANTYQIQANDLPVLETDSKFESTGPGSDSAYITGPVTTKGPLTVNAGSLNNPINMMQSSLALYEVMRLV